MSIISIYEMDSGAFTELPVMGESRERHDGIAAAAGEVGSMERMQQLAISCAAMTRKWRNDAVTVAPRSVDSER
jgi:hypothetical protein